MKHLNNNDNPWKIWKEWNAKEQAVARFHEDLARIKGEIKQLEESMFWSLVRQYSQDKGFLRVLSRFSGHTSYGWKVACGPDGRISRLIEMLGWEQLSRLILTIRRKKGY